jgi:uncharacterized lipoprotein YmbA
VDRRLLLAGLLGAAATLTGCGAVQLSADTLSASEVATTAEEALEAEVGARPEVTCPEGLDKEEGASTRCTLTAPDDRTKYGITVTVTSTEGDPELAVTVDDEPLD